MSLKIDVKYEPDDHSNLIPAVSGGRSIEGVAHATRIVLHFAATGQVRAREPFDDEIELYLAPPKTGSFVVDLFSNVDWKDAIVGGVLVGVPASIVAASIYDLIKHAFSSAAGMKSQPKTPPVQSMERDKSGTFDALLDAVTPGLKRAHYPIGGGVNIINVSGDNNTVVFNEASRQYLFTSIKQPGEQVADVSVGSLNVNRRTGRAFFDSEQRLIPFRVSENADPATMGVVADSLRRYANQFDFTSSKIRIRYMATQTADHRLKSILIFGAEPHFV